jgi:hypothetical protein
MSKMLKLAIAGKGKEKKSLKKKLPRQRTPLRGPQRGPAAASKTLPFS